MSLSVDGLRYFVATAQTGSFQAAAEQLHVTPQAVSKAIAMLEARFGARLVERDQRMRGLTRAGRALLDQARALLADMDALDVHMSGVLQDHPRGPVDIAAGGFFLAHVLAPVLASVTRQHPRLLPRLHAKSSDAALAATAVGEVDLCVGIIRPDHDDVAWAEGQMVRTIIVGRPQATGSWDSFGYVVPRAAGIDKRRALDTWPSGRFRRRIVVEVDGLEAAIAMCEAGVGVAFVPETVVHESLASGRLAILASPPVEVSNRLFVSWRATTRLSAAATIVRDALLAPG